jgi:transcriptional regulator with XRE-family HTH domain
MDYLDMKELGALARMIRIQAKLSQSEVAIRIGSSQPNVSAAERGYDTRYITVAIHIIEQIGNYELDGPYYRVKECLRHD